MFRKTFRTFIKRSLIYLTVSITKKVLGIAGVGVIAGLSFFAGYRLPTSKDWVKTEVHSNIYGRHGYVNILRRAHYAEEDKLLPNIKNGTEVYYSAEYSKHIYLAGTPEEKLTIRKIVDGRFVFIYIDSNNDGVVDQYFYQEEEYSRNKNNLDPDTSNFANEQFSKYKQLLNVDQVVEQEFKKQEQENTQQTK